MPSALHPPLGTRKIVLDTAALIAGTDSLFALGSALTEHSPPAALSSPVHFYVTPDVAAEARDARARARLQALERLGCISMRAPSAEAVAAVAAFAKRTGDYAVFSMTDLRVLALCYMMEVEGGRKLDLEGGGVTVREVRGKKGVAFEEVERQERCEREREEREREERGEVGGGQGWVTVEKVEKVTVEKKEVTKKKRRRKKKKNKAGNGDTDVGAVGEGHGHASVDAKSGTDAGSEGGGTAGLSSIGSTGIEGSNESGNKPVGASLWTEETERALLGVGALNMHEHAERLQLPDLAVVVGDMQQANGSGVEGGFENDDDGVGWINEDNLEEHLAKDGGEEETTEEELQRVACVTTDFAMQNTMLQMGLKLLSIDGRRTIRQIRHYALRCHTCGEVTRELQRKFCEKCGNASMHRVAFRVDKKGVARYFLNPKKQPLLRGTKYPIPMPRGGRHNKDLILCEDQIDPVQQRRIEKQRERLNVDVLDPSNFYNAGARFNPHDRPLIVGYGRRNPNEVGANRKGKR